MARSWLIDSRGLARKVRNASGPAAYQIKDCGANRECPQCHYKIDNSDVSPEWPGLPAGVKFDPSDVELLEHLASKCGVGDSKPHLFIDEFIPTLESDEGICYTHPENLPSSKKDGSSVHFFYRTINAYSTGQRKRRKIHDENGLIKEAVRWHKTGKTKPVMENGVKKGYKKIMVLYSSSKNGFKHDKANWVMHQYHLGIDEDEKEGEYVVCKIFYQQPKQITNNNTSALVEESDLGTSRTSPRTPKTTTPQPPRAVDTPVGDVVEHNVIQSPKDEHEYTSCLAGESQAAEDSLLCNEIMGSFEPFGDLSDHGLSTDFSRNRNHMLHGDNNASCGIADLENLELDTPPDFQLTVCSFLCLFPLPGILITDHASRINIPSTHVCRICNLVHKTAYSVGWTGCRKKPGLDEWNRSELEWRISSSGFLVLLHWWTRLHEDRQLPHNFKELCYLRYRA